MKLVGRGTPLVCLILLSAIPIARAQSESGILVTVAGATRANGAPARGFGGDNGLARRALLALANVQNECDPSRFEQISHVALDSQGNLYIADSANHRIRRVTPQGVITTIAGNGERPPVNQINCVPTGGAAAIGEGGAATAARLYSPAGIATHPNGGLVIADQQNNRVRYIGADGVITTIAGNGLHSFYAPQVPAVNSGLDWPTGLAVSASGTVYFSELHSGRVARITPDGRLVTVAGTGIPGFNGESGTATSMRLSLPSGIALDAAGNLYIADQGNHRVRRVTPDGALTTIAGSGAGFAGDGGPATAARLDRPADVKVDARGNVYISDMNNHRVRRIDPAGIITTVAGDGVPVRGPDGVPATASSLALPTGLAVDANGDVLVVDWGNYIVRRIGFGARPAIASNGVLNGASFAVGPIAPGSLFSIFGVNLAASTAAAELVPWPMQLGGASVRVNGVAAPLYFVSPGQINAQLPYSTATGEAFVEVTTPQGASPPEFVNVAAAAIGTFVFAGSTRAIVLNQDGSLNGDGNSEARGRVLTVFVTGIGAVNPEIPSGEAAPFDRLHFAAASFSTTLGGVDAPVQFLGLTPGFVGLAQANVLIPDGAATGAAIPLVFGTGEQLSNTATVSIR